MIDGLRKRVRNDDQFKRLLEIFYSEGDFYEVAESMKMIYFILKSEGSIIKTLKYSNLLVCLRKRNFFTKREEFTLSKREKEVKEIIEVLKDKDIPFFKTFLLCLKDLKQDNLIKPIVSLSEKYPSCTLDTFKRYLIKRYTNYSFGQISELDLPLSDDINIALIEVSEKDHKNNSTFFDYHSFLLKQETSYTRKFLNSYSDIVVENCRVVLIQGYPGSGKTCLTKQMCRKWAKGELLQTFSCVILLQLRDEDVASANTLRTLIELYIGSLTELTVNEIHKSHGKDIVFILEGWDELAETKQRSSFFTRLISGVLPEAVIIITSRPSAVKSLQFKHIQRRIEILGFTEDQVIQNIKHYFQEYSNGSELIEQFNSELNRLPFIKSSLFVPINLSIALYIFNKNGYKLPETFTDMYRNLVLIQLQRYQTRTSYGSASISDLDSLPPEIDEMLLRLSKMAYNNLQKDIILTFTEAEVKQFCFNSTDDSFDGMGLLQVTNHKHYLSIIKTYEFIHRTLQELLAAWYLSRQSKPFQKKQLQSIFNKKEFEMVWIFYAGLTNFENVSFKEFLPDNYMLKIKMASYSAFSWFLRKIIRNTYAKFLGMHEIVDKFIFGKQYSYDLSHCISIEFQTTLIAAVMEAQNPQLCKHVCESYLFNHEVCWFCVPESAATPQILSAISYCIAHSGKMWMIQCKRFDDSGADNLLRYLTRNSTNNKCSSSTNGSICVFDTDCSQSPITGIPRLVRTYQHLQWLILSNSKQVDDKFVAEVAEALEDNTCLQLFHLVGCNITSHSLKTIAHMLQKNKTLQWIGLANNMSTLTEQDIIMLLRTIRHHNNIVFMIFLDNAFHTSDKVQEQLQILNHTREQRGVRKLSLTLMDCFKRREIFERIISTVRFMESQVVSL